MVPCAHSTSAGAELKRGRNRDILLLTCLGTEWSREGEGLTMAKIGRNDPCACGSGKKYKRCCGSGSAPTLTAVESVPAVPPPAFDRRPMERTMAEMGRLL